MCIIEDFYPVPGAVLRGRIRSRHKDTSVELLNSCRPRFQTGIHFCPLSPSLSRRGCRKSPPPAAPSRRQVAIRWADPGGDLFPLPSFPSRWPVPTDAGKMPALPGGLPVYITRSQPLAAFRAGSLPVREDLGSGDQRVRIAVFCDTLGGRGNSVWCVQHTVIDSIPT